MSPETALEHINAAAPTKFSLVGQLSDGQSHSVYKIADETGRRAILKLSRNPMWRSQIERAKAATDHVRPLGSPVPSYIFVDSTSDSTFWVEDELAGAPTTTPTPEQLTAVLACLDRQKGQTISALQGQDWSWYVSGVVFRGDSGMVRFMMQFGEETSALAAQIEGLVLGLDAKALGNADLVHGNFSIEQVLFEGVNLTGIINWDQAGYGNYALDLVGLWYSLVNDAPSAEIVLTHLRQVADPQTIKILAAYKMLATISWHINMAGAEMATVIAQAKTALPILHAL